MIVSNTSRIFFTTLLLISLAAQGVCWCVHATEASAQAIEASAAPTRGSCCMTASAKEEDSSEGLCEITFGPLESQGGHCCGHCSLSNQLDTGMYAADAVVPVGPDTPVVAVAASDAFAATTTVASCLIAERANPVAAPASYILYASFRC